ncbi:MAG: helix-turn-helix transcriptional regulator [Clostridia bacterium]|nr:helix-turn-helix transcriptional regulator [Clostridia bacterium]MBR3974573.1 helix-turn-helix transcriptional regulator [Clostridia bacterium]
MNFDFSTKISALRREKGISQKKAAEDLEISQALLSHYEKGIRECNLDFVRKIAAYYSVTTDYLLGLSDTKQGFNEIFESTDLLSDNRINPKTLLRCMLYLSAQSEAMGEEQQVFFDDFFSLSIEKYMAMSDNNQSLSAFCDISMNMAFKRKKDNTETVTANDNEEAVPPPLCINTLKQHTSMLIKQDIAKTLNKK